MGAPDSTAAGSASEFSLPFITRLGTGENCLGLVSSLDLEGGVSDVRCSLVDFGIPVRLVVRDLRAHGRLVIRHARLVVVQCWSSRWGLDGQAGRGLRIATSVCVAELTPCKHCPERGQRHSPDCQTGIRQHLGLLRGARL
jgi:hypothetical protein